ncbi:hypothetical protein ACS3L2_005215 [Serratia marcescens]
MPTYSVYTRIASNVPIKNLQYDLAIYRMDSVKKKHFLLPPVFKQVFQSNYETQYHQTSETNDPLTTIYMVEIMLYRKHFNNIYAALAKPFFRMYTLGDLISGEACSEHKRENACYFETAGETKLANEGENTILLTITVPPRPFFAKEYPIGNPNDPFVKSKFDFEMMTRLNQFDYPDQGGTSLCGPAALFYCLLRDRPDVYEQSARELWLYGRTKIGQLAISPSEGCKHPSGFFYEKGRQLVSGLDWITLASLRDSENTIMSYSDISDQVAGITDWWSLSAWFEKVGYKNIFSNVGLSHSSFQDILMLNKYITQGCTVVSLISAGMFADYGIQDSSAKNHWVVWEGPIHDDNDKSITPNTSLDEIVNFKAFSWGNVKDQVKEKKTLEYVLKHTFGALVFEKVI